MEASGGCHYGVSKYSPKKHVQHCTTQISTCNSWCVCVCPVVDWRSKVMSCPVPLSEWDNFDGD